MLRKSIKILTLFFICADLFAQVLDQQEFSTHLRWSVSAPQSSFTIEKYPGGAILKTLDVALFEQVLGDLAKKDPSKQYVKKFVFDKEKFPQSPATLDIQFKDASIELFHFYQAREKKFFLDFWINPDYVAKGPSPQEIEIKQSNIEEESKKIQPAPPIVEKVVPVAKATKTANIGSQKILEVISGENKPIPVGTPRSAESDFRDFRYGAALFWDYGPLLPEIESDIDLKSKAPDYLFPIKDRDFKKDPKEAHLQLSINFYKQEKWGLMNKSIRLYQQKYGETDQFELNEFMKANALLKNNIRSKEKSKSIVNSAINVLEGILAKSEDYDIRKAVLRYIIQYSLDSKNYVKSLQTSKDLFVYSRENFDPEMKTRAVKVILYSLGKLQQNDQIEKFLSDKYAASLVPVQLVFAYKYAIYLKLNDHKKIINDFEKVQKSFLPSIDPTIIYNVAESYFRDGQYEKALTYFDKFSTDYSYFKESNQARLRMALTYDLMDKEIKKVIDLYERAMNRATDPKIRYEAKIRYASLFLNRKKILDEKDKEKSIYLDYADDEKEHIDFNMKKVLWLVRLRAFLNSHDYTSALTYLAGIPTHSMSPQDRMVFELDGAEILYGLMEKAYNSSEYAQTLKLWEIYKDKYGDTNGVNSHLHYLLAQSYLKIGIYEKFDKELENWKKMAQSERTFPYWVERASGPELASVLKELRWRKLLKIQDFASLEAELKEDQSNFNGVAPLNFYKGQLAFLKGEQEKAADYFEKSITDNNALERLLQEDLGDLLAGYIESLYALPDQSRFKKVAKAMLSDFSQLKKDGALKDRVKKRLSYLYLESLASDKDVTSKELADLCQSYLKEFSKSEYRKRVEYLLGSSFVKTMKFDEGKKILEGLLKDEATPTYLKKLVQGELTTLELKKRNL